MRALDTMSTPILVNTQGKFPDYLKSLSRKGRKQYAFVAKHNTDLSYKEVDYNAEQIREWMWLWERQLIRGEYRQWGFPVSYLDGLDTLVFVATNGELLALHFVEKHGRLLICHPPIYNKKLYSHRYMAKFMWFSLIKWACENGIDWIDLGGGERGTWPELIRERDNHPNTHYKWMYVPKEVKDNPDSQPEYVIRNNKLVLETD